MTWNAENKLATMQVGAVLYRYRYTADNARALKITDNPTGPDPTTVYLGPEAEIEPSGVWIKYVHDDVKRKGNGAGAAAFYHYRDHLRLRLRGAPLHPGRRHVDALLLACVRRFF